MYCKCIYACKERPASTFAPISCIGSKFTGISARPGARFAWPNEVYLWSLRNTVPWCHSECCVPPELDNDDDDGDGEVEIEHVFWLHNCKNM